MENETNYNFLSVKDLINRIDDSFTDYKEDYNYSYYSTAIENY